MLKNLNQEGQEDLRIVEHLDMQKLPESVQQMLSLASTPEEQDIVLMATLAAASAHCNFLCQLAPDTIRQYPLWLNLVGVCYQLRSNPRPLPYPRPKKKPTTY